MQKKLIAAAVAIVVVLGGFYWWHGQAVAPATMDGKEARNWTFKDAGANEVGNPQTEVSLNGTVVGTYQGTCSEIDGSGWNLLPGEDSGVICWFAGGGTEIGVFGGVVKQGDLDEGSAEIPGTRGNFRTLFSL